MQDVDKHAVPVHVARDAFFLALNKQPDISAECGRECPQCKKTAWKRSRWCWSCGYEFSDRVSIKFLLCLTLLSNVACAVLLYATAT